jgi:hypothetical protein
MWLDTMRQLWRFLLPSLSVTRFGTGLLVLLLGLTLGLDAKAIDTAPPHLCAVESPKSNKAAPENAQKSQDCYEFGAAVGELGLGWRKKLPRRVDWQTRKDAGQLCKQNTTEFGQKVDSTVPGGCVFLKTDACTIVTAGPISPASIGNAVRSCAP